MKFPIAETGIDEAVTITGMYNAVTVDAYIHADGYYWSPTFYAENQAWSMSYIYKQITSSDRTERIYGEFVRLVR